MTVWLMVEVDNLEEDADKELVRERAETALKSAFPYHDVAVDLETE